MPRAYLYRVMRRNEMTRKKIVKNDIECIRTYYRHISCKSGPTVTSYTVRKRVCEKLDNGLFFLLYYVFIVTRRKLMRPLLNNLLGIKPKTYAALLDHGIDIVIYIVNSLFVYYNSIIYVNALL